MSGVPILGTIVAGWIATFRMLIRLLARLLRRLQGRNADCGSPRRYKDQDCLTPPPDIRARPDPYIYSQEWLSARGLAVTWDNPDFVIIDQATGTLADRLALLPNHDYTIEAAVHNNSFMAAISTQVAFEVRAFGIGTPPLTALAPDVVNVPAFGTAIARTSWHTPASGGHNCLRALIFHVDDANPLNNIGQHNTDVAAPQSPERALKFSVGGEGALGRELVLRMNAYELPPKADCPPTFGERASVKYLRGLQERHDPRRYPVPEDLGAVLSHRTIAPRDGELIEVTLSFAAAATNGPRRAVNVDAYAGDQLMGGVTAYIGGELP